MNVTQLTFVLLPLCLLWATQPVRLLQLMVIAGVLEAAAAITIGSVGLQPGLLPGLLFLAFIVLQLALGVRYPGASLTWPLARPFMFVVLWAVVGSILLPRLLEGQVYVWPQKAEPPFILKPLAPSIGNLNQDFYLIIDCGFVLLISIFLSNPAIRLRPLFTTYLSSGFVVAGISVWQLANRLAGVPYPDQLFYSNPGWAILTTQQMGAMPRINGPFSEPSSLAGYMAAIVCSTGWLMMLGHSGSRLRLLFLTGLGVMVLSTSTTGFGVLAIVGCGIPAFAIISGNFRLMEGLVRLGLPLISVVALLALVVSVAKPEIFTHLAEVLDVTLNKQDSSSYQDRTAADIDSLSAFVDSFGLGTGWGSNRSSSLLPGLLASIGLPGVLGLLWFGMVLVQEVRRVHRVAPGHDHVFVIDGCCGALVGYLLGAVLSAPAITSGTFFFLLALLIGAVARVKIDAMVQHHAMNTSRIRQRRQPA